jgi:flagellar protein FliO/FliZ
MNLVKSPLYAVATGENTPIHLVGSSSTAHAGGGGNLVRTIVGLAIVLAVIFGLRWVLKQVKASREERGAGSGLSSVGSLPLGSNRSLHVVRAGREVLVVGSGEQGVTAVRSYDEEQARKLGILDAAEPETDAGPPSSRAAPAAQRALDTLRAWTVRG